MKTLLIATTLFAAFPVFALNEVQENYALSSATIDAANPLDSLANALKSIAHKDRDKLTQVFTAFEQQLDVKIAERRAQGAKPSAEAEEKLSEARDQLENQVRDLSFSTPETWNNARSNALAGVQNLRLALRDF
jgi:hypothetical protein